MPDTFTNLELLQGLVSPSGFSLTKHAIAPGAGEASEYAQMAKAQAFWLAQLQAALWVPAPVTPTTATATTGGTVAAGTYQVVVAYVSANGESIGSVQVPQITTGATSTLTVNSPPAMLNATGWYAYVSQVNGTVLTRQQAAGSPTAIGTNLVITAPPTSGGTNPLTVDSSSGIGAFPLDAYNHMTKRLAFYGNPAALGVYNGDR